MQTVREPGGQGQLEGQAQVAAQAVASEPKEQQMEPLAVVASQPHKRRAVSAATAVGAVGEGAQQPGGATEATDDAPARHGGRVEQRAACGARRRLAPYARGRAAA